MVVSGQATLVRSAILAIVPLLGNAFAIVRLEPGAARLDFAVALFTLDLVDVGNGTAVAAGVLGAVVALGANAATARVEGGEDVDAFGASRAVENIAALHALALAVRLGAIVSPRTTRRLRVAGRRAGAGGLAARAGGAVVAVRVRVAGALVAVLLVIGRNRATGALSAALGTGARDGAGRAVGALVAVGV